MYQVDYILIANMQQQSFSGCLNHCTKYSLQGAIQLSCMRKITDAADVEQQTLCQAAPFECTTAHAVPYCDATAAATEQPSTIPGVSQLVLSDYSPKFSLSQIGSTW